MNETESIPQTKEEKPYRKPKTRAVRWIIIGAAAALIAAVCVITAIMLSPRQSLDRAVDETRNEISARLRDTPFYGLRALIPALEHGTVGVEFAFADESGEPFIRAGNLALTSDSARRAYGFYGEFEYPGVTADISVLLDTGRLAFRSSLIDENYYGVFFPTFERDIEIFAEATGLPDEIIARFREIIETVMNAQNSGAADAEPLERKVSALFDDFYGSLEFTSENETVVHGGDTLRAGVYTCEITSDALLGLLRGIYDISEAHGVGVMQNEFADTLDTLESEHSGAVRVEITAAGDRIINAFAESSLVFGGEPLTFTANADFGADADDDWVFTMNYPYGGAEQTVSVRWTYEPGVNTWHVIRGAEPFVLQTVWDGGSGDFTVIVEDATGELRLSGNITHDGGAFEVNIDTAAPETFRLWAESGADIPEPAYINLDEWDIAFIERIVEAVDVIYGQQVYD